MTALSTLYPSRALRTPSHVTLCCAQCGAPHLCRVEAPEAEDRLSPSRGILIGIVIGIAIFAAVGAILILVHGRIPGVTL